MKWLTDFFGKEKQVPLMEDKNWFPSEDERSLPALDSAWSDELFNLCWDREALLVEIETAKRQKKKSSHLVEALARNTQRRLELELSHNGKNGAA